MERTGAVLSKRKIRGLYFLKKKAIVFVAVGTDPQSFDRLLVEIDRLAGKNFFPGPVFCQTGYSPYQPKHAAFKNFLSPEEFEEKIKNAELVISHGGAGSIGTALQYKKKCVAMARLQRFGEHANDHQLELVNALEREGRILVAKDEKGLEKKIGEAKQWQPRASSGQKRIVELLEEFVEKNF